jgi:uroporphyrinogen-III synthase
MDSEGLLALPGLQDIADTAIGLVTAPGGRGLLAPALQARGADVLRADVYARVPVAPSPRALAVLRETEAPLVLALSSGEALQRTLATAPGDVAAILRSACVVAASDRLAALVHGLGFTDVVVAHGPRPRDLLDAAVRRTSGSMAAS